MPSLASATVSRKFGAQIIARIEFYAVVARVPAYVFERQYLADDSRAVFDHA